MSRSCHEAEPEGRPDQAQPPCPVLLRRAVGYVGLGCRQRAARGACQDDGEDEIGERLGEAEQQVGERGPEQTEQEDRASPMAVREPAEERAADELHRGVEGTEQADEHCAGSIRARVEWQQGDHDAVPDHVHEHRNEQEH